MQHTGNAKPEDDPAEDPRQVRPLLIMALEHATGADPIDARLVLGDGRAEVGHREVAAEDATVR